MPIGELQIFLVSVFGPYDKALVVGEQRPPWTPEVRYFRHHSEALMGRNKDLKISLTGSKSSLKRRDGAPLQELGVDIRQV